MVQRWFNFRSKIISVRAYSVLLAADRGGATFQVVYCDHTAVPRALAALQAGAKEVRLLPDATAVRVEAGRFRFPSQRVVGGELPPARQASRVWYQPLNRAEMTVAREELSQRQREAAAAEDEVGRLELDPSSPAEAVAAAQQRSAEKRRQQVAAALVVESGTRRVTHTPQAAAAAPLPGWRPALATAYSGQAGPHSAVRGRTVLLSEPTTAERLEVLDGAKRLLLGCLGNLSAVRCRVLDWWASLSSIDASRRPNDNTRVILVLGGRSAANSLRRGTAESRGQGCGSSSAPAEELFAGLLIYQLNMSMADLDLGPDNARARGLLRRVVRAAAASDLDDSWTELAEQAMEEVVANAQTDASRETSVDKEARAFVATALAEEISTVDRYGLSAVALRGSGAMITRYTLDPSAHMSGNDLRFDESIRHKL
eukprot:SAG31_NODE_1632_length_7694_cov_12.123239_5_plen_428_part_00